MAMFRKELDAKCHQTAECGHRRRGHRFNHHPNRHMLQRFQCFHGLTRHAVCDRMFAFCVSRDTSEHLLLRKDDAPRILADQIDDLRTSTLDCSALLENWSISQEEAGGLHRRTCHCSHVYGSLMWTKKGHGPRALPG